MKKAIILLSFLFLPLALAAQTDKKEIRSGNRKYAREKYQEAEIEYRKAALRDSASLAAWYNLASSLYRQEDYDGAGAAIDKVAVPDARVNFNKGDIALQKKDYKAAVDAFREALLETPGDLDAKENYIYAKMMLRNQQDGGGGGGGGSDQDQNQDQDQDQDRDQNQDQNQDQDQNRGQDQNQDRDQGLTPQQAQQLLRAVQAKERETQEKVEKARAAELKSRQKEKNW